MAKMTKMSVRKVTVKSTTKAVVSTTTRKPTTNTTTATQAQLLANAQKRKAAATALIGTKTPDGRPIRTMADALYVYDFKNAQKRGVVSGRIKRN